MTDELLGQATRALRERSAEPALDAAHTRARVMLGLHRTRQRKTRAVALLPLAAILLGGTAWAAASGQLQSAWRAVKQSVAFYIESETPEDPAPPAQPNPGRGRAGHGAVPAVGTEPPESRVEEPVGEEPPDEEPVNEEPLDEAQVAVDGAPSVQASNGPEQAGPRGANAPSSRAALGVPRSSGAANDGGGSAQDSALSSRESTPSSGALHSTVTSAPSSAPSTVGERPALVTDPAAAAELARYRAAHTLHFERRAWVLALRGWDDYLQRYPKGRFALEARYNRALCLVRLGRNGEAREALEPFAAGRYGGYREVEAKELSTALGSGP